MQMGETSGRSGLVRWSILAMALGVSGCSVGPKFQPPQVDEPASLAATEVITGSAKEMADITPAVAWWMHFGDTRLNALVAEALANNQDLEAAKERIREARASRRSASAAWLPNVDGSLSRTRSSDSYWSRSRERGGGHSTGPLQTVAPNRQNTYTMGVDASWEIDIWDKTGKAVDAADAQILVNEYAYRGTVLSLVSETALAYFEIMAAEENLDILREEVRNRAEFLNLVKMREDNGLASALDTKRQQVEEANTRADLPAAEARLAVAHYRLATLLGKNPENFKLEERRLDEFPRLPLIPEGLPIRLARQRPDVLQREAALRAALARVGVAQGEMLPSIVLSANAGYRSGEIDKFLSKYADEWSLSQALRVPIFDGGARYGRLESERAAVREAMASYRQSILNALEEINSALVTADKNRERRAALVEATTSAGEALRIAREQYRAGLIDLLDYLDSQRIELQTRQVLIASDRTIVDDTVRLYRALGGGWDTGSVDPVAPARKDTWRRLAEDFPLFAVALTPEEKLYPKFEPKAEVAAE